MSSAGKTARVGAAAIAVGLSLAGPQAAGLATAEADDPGHAETVAATADRVTTKSTATRPGGADGRAPHTVSAAAPKPAQSTEESGASRVAARTSDRTATARGTRAERSPEKKTAARRESRTALQTAIATPEVSAPDVDTTAVAPTAGETPSVQSTPAPVVDTAIAATADTAIASAPSTFVAAATGDIVSTLFGPIQSFIEGIGLLIRRTFFNQAPTVDPVQLTGWSDGPITGTLGASDPEGDPLLFAVTDNPNSGMVTIGPDGNFVYEPGAGFTGRDSFNVVVSDLGFHINLLDPFRPAGTEAYVQVAQNAEQAMLTFAFTYSSDWSREARDALESSAELLAAYFVVTSPTTITFSVTGENSPTSDTLASAGSDLTSSGGFLPTVVQQKIQTGIDANGRKADGEIDFNFGNPWAYGNSVNNSQYDFTSTAMHELMHSFGFLSYTLRPGENTETSWTLFDQYMVTSDGTRVISESTYLWDTAYNANLTGRNGGLYFGGPNAVAAYGSYVPLYTPSRWEEGSSVSHLDDYTFTGSDTQLMNAVTDTGLGVRVLSPVELGILKDLGYTVTDAPVYAFVVLLGVGFIRRHRTEPNLRSADR